LASDDLSDAGIATAQRQLHFRSGSKPEMAPHKRHDRSTLKSRHRPATRHVSFVSFAIFCTAEYGTLFNHPFGAGTAVIIRIQSPMYR
jgi:hypothetical protein